MVKENAPQGPSAVLPSDEDDPPFIVAEISTNWPKEWPVPRSEFIGHKFEAVIEVNRRRGYRLHSFQLNRMVVEAGKVNETIIAVFEKVQACEPVKQH